MYTVLPPPFGYKAARQFPVGANPYSVAIGDLNGDGKPDLASANSGSNTVSALPGNGDCTFQAAVTYEMAESPRLLLPQERKCAKIS
ncbi:MAG: VCBS repeat-containing protein [Armatimonadetes bacterium]|nr:VCBS repeat-containing protein [Armatimonadota bacterium]